jgi:hypothetical protein
VVGWLPVFTRPETVQIWQEGNQPNTIETEAMLRQKLEYACALGRHAAGRFRGIVYSEWPSHALIR